MLPFAKRRIAALAAGFFALTAPAFAQTPAPSPTEKGLEFVPRRDAFGTVVWRIKADPPAAPAAGTTTITFEIYQDDFRQYRWRIKGPAGRTVAASVESYRTRDDANRVIDAIRAGAQLARLDDLTR